MKFRVRLKNREIYPLNDVFLGEDGKIYSEGICGICKMEGAKAEFLVGQDSNGASVFENDVLISKDYPKIEYIAGFDLDIGAYLQDRGSKIPFKQAVFGLVKRG